MACYTELAIRCVEACNRLTRRHRLHVARAVRARWVAWMARTKPARKAR